MGSNSASAGGSDTADERKQDSYAKQFRKNYTLDKKGKPKEKSKIRKAIENSPGGKVIESVADSLNYKRRLAFAEKKGLNLLSKSEEYVLSPAGKAYLDNFGYSKSLETPQGNNDNDGGSNQVVQAPTDATMTAPTTAEVSQSSATDATDAATVDTDDPTYIKRKTKRQGRSLTILTSSKGVSDGLTLGKRSLLGS